MRTSKKKGLGALAAVAVLALAGCGSSTPAGGGSTAGAGGFKVPDLKPLDKLGTPEGEVKVLAWPGYVEDGSNDPKVDWVSDFEKSTGCNVTVKTFGTSDEAVQLMRTGEYDTVSASGDATLRLIAAGDVEPVNTSLITNYPDIFDSLKNQPWNSVNGVSYGIPHGRGANLLMYRTDLVKPAPDSWGAVFDKAGAQAGKVTAYDSPIYIADAALYLMSTKPELGIKDPYALDDKQLAAAVDLLKAQKANVSEYWSDYLKEVQAFKNGTSTVGTTWQVIANVAQAEKAPVEAILPKEGATGWSDTWMVSAKSKHKTCAYKFIDHIVSPKVNAQIAEYFGEAPANRKACAETADPNHCKTYHAEDEAYFAKVHYWNTPISACLDGRTNVKCTDYAAWTKAWTEIRNS
ncbi:spermidine/putrescine ABC transporter substrate-binding protein [Intrasporangium oryzae NRRL B-24470]|uniref:Spermidine/putrescine ABC transporter substrate-binding protein n=1 Tax=Intrasporangium oryzae NRRL B-24470 TaxID=1386089 RepID=W9G4Z2_9MICO|nr:ABC transporter substrate-binding protein [Intrasporangium oryzae]EWT01065.1 spermidine/putrescine ABC transporter substrate-binding protein [Intrasporangium oryzae NRRL B-24470]